MGTDNINLEGRAVTMQEQTQWWDMVKGCQVFRLQGRTKTLSTGALGGGLRTDLTAVVNINCQGAAYECEMLADTYEEELAMQVTSCGIDPARATALSTAAWTELAAEAVHSFQNLTVRAVVSGGIDHNATAPGDPAGYYEENGKFTAVTDSPKPGTLNTFVFINQELSDGAMVRAMMLCAEAKTAAVRELLLGSCYSSEIASGSGTDGCVIASAMGDGPVLTDASGHGKLGELIGAAVKEAVKKALLNQTGANGARQFRLFERVKRFGITQGSLYDLYTEHRSWYNKHGIAFGGAAAFDRCLYSWGQNSNLVLTVSLYVHLMDQERWGLIMPGEVLREGRKLLQEQLYVRKDTFLGTVYEEEAFAPAWLGEDPVTFLQHVILLWLAH